VLILPHINLPFRPRPPAGYTPAMTSPSPADRPLSLWEQACLVLLLIGVIGFGFLTVQRSAYSEQRMTDFGVYTRAAWAVRTGQDPYEIVDDRNWHYTYPPPFVLMLTPLADPPLGADRYGHLPFAVSGAVWYALADRTGYLPFDMSVAVWYALNVLFAAVAVHWFVLAVLPHLRPYSRRWWYARLIPFDACIPALGYTLARGQANVFVLLLLAGAFLAAVRRRSFRSGVWLAAAVCVKVIPGLLVLVPLVRRDWRCLLGVAAGGVLFLGVIPAAVWGPQGAVDKNVAFVREVAFPGLTNAGSKSREAELIGTTKTDSQAFHAVVHAWRYPDKATRPTNSDGLSKGLHYAVGLGMIGLTVWAFMKPKAQTRPSPGWGDPVHALLFLGLLSAVTVHLAPASHMHFYAFSLPLVVALAADDLRRRPAAAVPSAGVLAGLFGWTALTTVPLLDTWPTAVLLRDFGLAVGANVGLWAWGVVRLRATLNPPLP
jgi:alpha-1,2-mannosyltransferase